MKKKIIGFGSFLSALCLAIAPVHSQTVATCPIYNSLYDTNDYIPVGQISSVDPEEPAYITGSQPGSRVNVRWGPGTHFDVKTYGLVGDAVKVIGLALDTNCETWLWVRFPISSEFGWIHGDFVMLHYPRGWWD